MLPPGEIPNKESHGVEFKKSLAELREGAQTIVAFANAHGGELYFGIDPKGQIVGVDIGANTLEKLASDLDRYIYPYVPAAISEVSTTNGKTVIQVSAIADTPPVIGAYLYSSQQLDKNAQISAGHLVGYRRVGRTNQKTDFMWLRGRQTSDPVVLVDGRDSVRTKGIITAMECAVWLAEGGPAYDLWVSTEPSIGAETQMAKDLPGSSAQRGTAGTLQVSLGDAHPTEFELIARCKDDWGCQWESRRLMRITYEGSGSIRGTSEFSRRIITLPPKNLANPT